MARQATLSTISRVAIAAILADRSTIDWMMSRIALAACACANSVAATARRPVARVSGNPFAAAAASPHGSQLGFQTFRWPRRPHA